MKKIKKKRILNHLETQKKSIVNHLKVQEKKRKKKKRRC